MFSKIRSTDFPPKFKSILVWDGECAFCRYWITHWKHRTGKHIVYAPYQEVATSFPDIPVAEFKKASRLIETDGRIYSGPDSAYRSFTYFYRGSMPWHGWYHKYQWFTRLSDLTYMFIARNRPAFYRLTLLCFGRDPEAVKPYWLLYLFLFLALAGFLLWSGPA